MKYSANYTKELSLSGFDEVKVIYDDHSIEQILSFAESRPNQRIILVIKDVDNFVSKQGYKKLNTIYQTYPELNISAQIGAAQVFNTKLFDTWNYTPLEMPHFFGCHITNFEELRAITSCYVVSDIIISEGICFSLDKVKKICDEHQITIRAYANVAQAGVSTIDPILKFFMRPEDVVIYENYIDVIEFWGPEDRQETLLQIYKSGKWYNDLNPLIISLDMSIDSRKILPMWASWRAKCSRLCIQGSSCRMCWQELEIHDTMKEKGFLIADK